MIFITAQAPAAVAQQEGALASAVVASYRIPSNMLRKPRAVLRPTGCGYAETAAILKATAIQQNGATRRPTAST